MGNIKKKLSTSQNKNNDMQVNPVASQEAKNVKDLGASLTEKVKAFTPNKMADEGNEQSKPQSVGTLNLDIRLKSKKRQSRGKKVAKAKEKAPTQNKGTNEENKQCKHRSVWTMNSDTQIKSLTSENADEIVDTRQVATEEPKTSPQDIGDSSKGKEAATDPAVSNNTKNSTENEKPFEIQSDLNRKMESVLRISNSYHQEVNKAIYGDTVDHPPHGSPAYFQAAEEYALYGNNFLDFPKELSSMQEVGDGLHRAPATSKTTTDTGLATKNSGGDIKPFENQSDLHRRLMSILRKSNPYLREVNKAIYGEAVNYPPEGSPEYFQAAEEYALYGDSFMDFPKDLSMLGAVRDGLHSAPTTSKAAGDKEHSNQSEPDSFMAPTSSFKWGNDNSLTIPPTPGSCDIFGSEHPPNFSTNNLANTDLAFMTHQKFEDSEGPANFEPCATTDPATPLYNPNFMSHVPLYQGWGNNEASQAPGNAAAAALPNPNFMSHVPLYQRNITTNNEPVHATGSAAGEKFPNSNFMSHCPLYQRNVGANNEPILPAANAEAATLPNSNSMSHVPAYQCRSDLATNNEVMHRTAQPRDTRGAANSRRKKKRFYH